MNWKYQNMNHHRAVHHKRDTFRISGTLMTTSLDKNLFFHLLISPAPRYRIARHALMWATAILVIYRGELYLSIGIESPTFRAQYVALATFVYAALVIIIYASVAQLIHRFVLLNFRPGPFVVGFFVIHAVISILLYYQFLGFARYFELSDLPRFYNAHADRLTRLSIWQVPFDSFIVGILAYSLVYSYVLYPLFLKIVKDLFTIKAKENQLVKEKTRLQVKEAKLEKDNLQLQVKEAKLEKDNLQLEFDFLKSQISPHFLFNTLNNIYSFSIKSPAKVPDTILKLADLMRYTLYETESPFVPLVKEISFLSSYVALQRIRHEADADLTYTVTGDSGQLFIPPLMLIVFVENAFRHGFEASLRTGWIHIGLTIDNGTLCMKVANSTAPVKQEEVAAGGIGLKNVRKRLELFYPGHHQLRIVPQTQEYHVSLTIDLQHYQPATWKHPTESSLSMTNHSPATLSKSS